MPVSPGAKDVPSSALRKRSISVPTSSAGAAANACGLPSSGVSPVAPEIVHDRPPSMLTLMVPAPSKAWIVPDGP